MTEQDKQKLNEKLARWAGFEQADIKKHYYFEVGGERLPKWKEPNTDYHIKLPRFTDSLDACLEWLVPKLGMVALHTYFKPAGVSTIPSGLWEAVVWDNPKNKIATMQYVERDKEPALALCLAIEELIDGLSVY